MAIYSHSKLSTFEQCPFRYKLRYIDKIKPEIESTIEAHLGSITHEALEWLYTKVQHREIPTIDDLILRYSEIWEEKFNPNFIIVKKEFTDKDYFQKGIQFLINYYTLNHPFDDNTIELEKKVLFELETGTKIIGYIDRLVHHKDKEEIEVHDYKTANFLPPKEKFEKDKQLALYSIAIKEIFGQEKKIKLVWHYLAHGQRIEIQKTNEDLKKLKKETLDLIKKIESTKVFPYNQTRLCDWCEYKSMCPAFGNSIPEHLRKTSNQSVDFCNSLKKEIEKSNPSNKNQTLDIW